MIFDLDNTLYRNDRYVATQLTVLVERLAREIGRSAKETQDEIDLYREQERRRSGTVPSMAASFVQFGVPFETSAAWRAELFEPERFLARDPALESMLSALAPARLSVVSNNPVSIADRTLKTLGVRRFFEIVVGLDTCMVPKPDPRGYLYVYDQLTAKPERSVAVGDRFAVDLEPVLSLGGGGIELEEGDTVHPIDRVLRELIDAA